MKKVCLEMNDTQHDQAGLRGQRRHSGGDEGIAMAGQHLLSDLGEGLVAADYLGEVSSS